MGAWTFPPHGRMDESVMQRVSEGIDNAPSCFEKEFRVVRVRAQKTSRSKSAIQTKPPSKWRDRPLIRSTKSNNSKFLPKRGRRFAPKAKTLEARRPAPVKPARRPRGWHIGRARARTSQVRALLAGLLGSWMTSSPLSATPATTRKCPVSVKSPGRTLQMTGCPSASSAARRPASAGTSWEERPSSAAPSVMRRQAVSPPST